MNHGTMAVCRNTSELRLMRNIPFLIRFQCDMVLVSGAAQQLVGPSFHQKQLSPWLNEDPLVPRQTLAVPKNTAVS